MGKTRTFLFTGFLLSLIGSTWTKDCDYDEFSECVQDVDLGVGDFHVISEQQMREVCDTKLRALQCTTSYVNDCMKIGEKEIFQATTGGKLKVVEQMCIDGSRINKGYLENIECWEKVQDDVDFCYQKFNESQLALSKSSMIHRLKVFYGCCAFEWHRNCLAKVARAKCSEEAGNFVYYVSTILGGDIQELMCSSSYSSCHGLHGVEHEVEHHEESETFINNLSSPNVKSEIFLYVTTAYALLLCL